MKFVELNGMYINMNYVTEFFYDKTNNITKIAFVGEDGYRHFRGNHVKTLYEASTT